MTRGLKVPLIVGVLWIALVGLFDVVLGFNAYRQVRAERFPTAGATVTYSDIEMRRSKGSTYGPVIRYSYEVGGERYAGDTYQYGGYRSSDWKWARDAVRAHPVGATTRVHYDPGNPSDSVIDPGLHGSDLFMALFLTPFNAVGIAFLLAPVFWLRDRGRRDDPGVPWFAAGTALRVRLPRYFSPLEAGLGSAVLATFLLTFVVAFGFGAHPSMAVMIGAWALAPGVGVVAAAWCWVQERRGEVDLVIDLAGGGVSLPATFGRKERMAIARREIGGVDVKTVEEPGRRGSVQLVHRVRITRREGAAEVVAERCEAENAEKLAAWLRGKLGV